MILRYLLIAVGLVVMFTGCNNLVSLVVGDETVVTPPGREHEVWLLNLALFLGGLALAAIPEALRFRRERNQKQP